MGGHELNLTGDIRGRLYSAGLATGRKKGLKMGAKQASKLIVKNWFPYPLLKSICNSSPGQVIR